MYLFIENFHAYNVILNNSLDYCYHYFDVENKEIPKETYMRIFRRTIEEVKGLLKMNGG